MLLLLLCFTVLHSSDITVTTAICQSNGKWNSGMSEVSNSKSN